MAEQKKFTVTVCKKCTGKAWEKLTEEEYSCLKCGNLLYMSAEDNIQQIELTMRSQREKDYVKMPNGAIVPRYDETMEAIRFRQAMERRRRVTVTVAEIPGEAMRNAEEAQCTIAA